MDSALQSVPMMPKPKIIPNFDTTYIIKELFQDEYESSVPSKQLSKNILTSLQYEKPSADEKETFRSINCLEKWNERKDNLLNFAENVLEAYTEHEKAVENVRKAEKNICKTHMHYVQREEIILEDEAIQDLLILKRQPLFKDLDKKFIKNFNLLQGEAGLPPSFEAKLDFRVQNYSIWKKRLESISQDSLIMAYINRIPDNLPIFQIKKSCRVLKEFLPSKQRKMKKDRLKKPKTRSAKKEEEIFRAHPKTVFFTNYKPGEVYFAEVIVKNVSTKGMQFQLKPTCSTSPFNVLLNSQKTATKLYPGLSFQIKVQFSPTSLDMAAEDIHITLENGKDFLIPLIAYLEPPVLKTHKDIDEFTRVTSEKIASSCIECGSCFTGDTKVTKLRFQCFHGSGEFFIMSSDNWERSYVKNLTIENILEIPPFRIYPAFFKMEKNEVIDLFVEFFPKNSGMHVENIMITCDNGEVRSLDLLGDAIGWHSYFFSFQDNLLKQLPVDADDDSKIKYYLDFNETLPTGKVEKVFCISNNSNMLFEFQWKIREPNISTNADNYFKIQKNQVNIDPENGTLEPNSVLEFLVTINFENAKIGNYRTVLSLYVLNLPYQCIEEDDTIIQPTGFVRHLYSQSLFGEEEFTANSPELLSLQGTYETLQESIKSYVECQTKSQMVPKSDFSKNMCIPNPVLCAKPLKKSKTYFNINDSIDDEGVSCICRCKTTERESNSESYTSNIKEEKPNESQILKSEVIWDFIDILVDEIELWVEVSSPIVFLHPAVIETSSPLYVNEPQIFKEVKVINCSRFPLKCKWMIYNKKDNLENHNKDNLPVSLLFNKSTSKTRKETFQSAESLGNKSQYINTVINNGEDIDAYQSFDKRGQKYTFKKSDCLTITTEPAGSFVVQEMSEFVCKIGLMASQSGKYHEILKLSVFKDIEIPLILQGQAVQKYFTATPQIIDFGLLKKGVRTSRRYNIENEYSKPLFFKISKFDFDFETEKFSGPIEADSDKEKEFQLNKKSCLCKYYRMDCKKQGINCSLLEISCTNNKLHDAKNQYIMVLGDVNLPDLSLSCPRFENAILAPSETMYVGKTISCKITLKNKRSVETSFTWNNPFGCHSTKIKIKITPKTQAIGMNEKLQLNVDLTPLDEGIISHCYVPCYFCRNSEPLILSIVGVVEKLNVTFEIIDYPKQTHADSSNFIKTPFYHTILRVPWPLKSFDPNLGLKFITETDIMNMNCYCSEVEKEMARVLNVQNSVREVNPTEAVALESQSQITEIIDKDTPGRSKISKDMRVYFEEISGENNELSMQDFSNIEKKKSEINSVQKYDSTDSFSQTVQIIKSELEFLEVPFQTPVKRQFVIRNETPVDTSFFIKVLNFGKGCEGKEKKIEKIRDSILGIKDNFGKNDLGKQPLLITAEPSEGNLCGFDAVLIEVTAIGNTWGEYKDFLICHIKGIEEFHLKVFIQVVGHPVYFPMFQNHEQIKPVLRFQPIGIDTESVTKRIRVVNRSAIPINVLWIVLLIEPLIEEKEGYNLCVDSNANLDSNHSSEESTKSVKIYLPKNVSKTSVTFKNVFDLGEWSPSKTIQSNGKGFAFSDKTDIQYLGECEKVLSSNSTSTLNEELKSEKIQFPYKIDPCNFVVEPKQMDFEPFEEKRLIVTFNPRCCKLKNDSVEFKAALTACVKLKAEFEKCSGIYNRPCGMNFVSEVLNFDAVLEISRATFEILRGDLKFHVDANEVLKSPSKKISIVRKFMIKNNNEKSMSLTIEVEPGIIFHVKKINTLNKIYKNYKSENHIVNLDPREFFEMELECSVTFKDIIYAYEQLQLNKKKNFNIIYSDEMKVSKAAKSMNAASSKHSQEPWSNYFDYFSAPKKLNKTDEKCIMGAKDSIHLNFLRLSSKSYSCDLSAANELYTEGEGEGEYLTELPCEEDVSCRANVLQNLTILEEKISIVHADLITQTFAVELYLHFPAIKISPKNLDFGNVYINETGIRYCSLINMKGFPTSFNIKSNCKVPEFVAKPSVGNLPSTNYKSNIGVSITIEFTPTTPGYFADTLLIYCNEEMEFDCYQLQVAGLGTWNEKYRRPKLETYIQLPGICNKLKN